MLFLASYSIGPCSVPLSRPLSAMAALADFPDYINLPDQHDINDISIEYLAS